MRKERNGHVLQTTALVNEAIVRLLGGNVLARAPNRRYLFAAASRAMRVILVDHGRSRRLERRSTLEDTSLLDEILIQIERDGAPIEELNLALEELEESTAGKRRSSICASSVAIPSWKPQRSWAFRAPLSRMTFALREPGFGRRWNARFDGFESFDEFCSGPLWEATKGEPEAGNESIASFSIACRLKNKNGPRCSN